MRRDWWPAGRRGRSVRPPARAANASSVTLSRGRRFAAVYGPTALVLVFGGLAYWGTVREHRSRAAVSDSYRVVEALQLLFTRLVDAETGQRGYLLTDRT